MSLCFKLWSNIHDIAFTSRAILTCVHFSNGEYLLSIVQPVEFFIPRVLKQYTLAYLNLAINTADAKIADLYFTDKKPEMRCTETKKKKSWFRVHFPMPSLVLGLYYYTARQEKVEYWLATLPAVFRSHSFLSSYRAYSTLNGFPTCISFLQLFGLGGVCRVSPL